VPAALFRRRGALGLRLFAYSSEKYELSIFPSGVFFGPPDDAFEVSANLYLQ
jgi:hypothetical protein